MDWFAGKFAGKFLGWFGFDGTNAVDPYGPAGVATLVLDIEEGFKVANRWITDVHKFRAGNEKRISRNDAPQERYDGSAILLGDLPRSVRARLARSAAQGSQFLLGLPHEEISVIAVSGSTATCNEVSLCDWTKPGQRCVGVRYDEDDTTIAQDLVIQDATGDVLTFDVAPHADTCLLMPTRPVYLEPQQSFARYPVNAEVWNIQARAAIFDFAPDLASLALGPITVSAGFDDLSVVARTFTFNTTSFAMLTYAGAPTGTYSGFPVPTFFYVAGTTTLGDLAAALANATEIRLAGDYNPADTIAAGDSFGATALTGSAVAGSIGRGATLTTYAGDGPSRPVWHEPLLVETTATDSVQAMTQIIDHGGIPYALGTADEPDWGRAVSFLAQDRAQWQWLKLFLATVVGRQKAFWLPTWRDDLTFLSKAAGTVTVSTEDDSDFTAWWPYLREHVQIEEESGAITYAKITAQVDNGNGTRTLTIVDDDDDPITLATSAVKAIGWLELCRFEADDFEFSCGAEGISMDAVARAVQE
jgi:hypothetical protein